MSVEAHPARTPPGVPPQQHLSVGSITIGGQPYTVELYEVDENGNEMSLSAEKTAIHARELFEIYAQDLHAKGEISLDGTAIDIGAPETPLADEALETANEAAVHTLLSEDTIHTVGQLWNKATALNDPTLPSSGEADEADPFDEPLGGEASPSESGYPGFPPGTAPYRGRAAAAPSPFGAPLRAPKHDDRTPRVPPTGGLTFGIAADATLEHTGKPPAPGTVPPSDEDDLMGDGFPGYPPGTAPFIPPQPPAADEEEGGLPLSGGDAAPPASSGHTPPPTRSARRVRFADPLVEFEGAGAPAPRIHLVERGAGPAVTTRDVGTSPMAAAPTSVRPPAPSLPPRPPVGTPPTGYNARIHKMLAHADAPAAAARPEAEAAYNEYVLRYLAEPRRLTAPLLPLPPETCPAIPEGFAAMETPPRLHILHFLQALRKTQSGAELLEKLRNGEALTAQENALFEHLNEQKVYWLTGGRVTPEELGFVALQYENNEKRRKALWLIAHA